MMPPKAYPRITSCTSGKIVDMITRIGLRRNRLKSRSRMARMRCMLVVSRQLSVVPSSSLQGVLYSSFIIHHSQLTIHNSLGLPLINMADIIAISGLQGVAQLAPGVMHEDVIERGALDGERSNRRLGAPRSFDQFHRGAGSVQGGDAKNMVLGGHPLDVGQLFQRFKPALRD